MLQASLTSPGMAYSQSARQARMVEALGEMPVNDREVLSLRYCDGLSSREIAERLGKTHASVRLILSRSLKNLQDRVNS